MNESTQQTQAASYAVTAYEACAWDASQLAELNRHLDKPFGEVERFNQALASTLWMDSHRVEFTDDSGVWLHAEWPTWQRELRYRILPKREVV